MTANYDAQGNRVKVKFPWLNSSTADEDFAYNPHGQLTVITNAPDGNGYRSVDAFSYYSSGPQNGFLQSCTEDAGSLALTSSFEYDARGNVTRCVDPRTNDWLYTYNALDQLVQSSSPLLGGGGGGGGWRISTQFSYDAADNLTLCAVENRDENGVPSKTA
jgi:YD repeat-containing protein